MNRQIYISLGVIAVLVLYIFISRLPDRDTVRQLAEWQGSPDRIELISPEKSIIIILGEKRWVIGEEKYPADKNQIGDIIDKVNNIRLTDIISERAHYARYGLDPESAFQVKLSGENRILSHVFIGNKGATKQHTFMRSSERAEIYLAEGTFDDLTGKQISQLRDKEIFSVQKDAVESFEITYKNRPYSFKKEITAPEVIEGESADEAVPAAPQTRWVSVSHPGVSVDQSRIEDILSLFNPLKAGGFPETANFGRALCEIKISAREREFTVTIYPELAGTNRYPALSGESSHYFEISKSNAEKLFIEKIQDISGGN